MPEDTPKPKRRRNRPDKYQIPEAELRDLYEVQRLRDVDIAERYGCSAEVIRVRRLRYGIPTMKTQPGKARDITREQLVDLYERQKLTQAQIAEKLGVSEMTVYRQVRRYDLERQNATTRRGQASILEDPDATGLVIGAVFGDGYLPPTASGAVRLEMKHAVSQGAWCRWKAERLSHVLDFPYVREVEPSNAQGWNVQDQVRAISARHPDLGRMRPWFYGPDGNRRFGDEALARMTELTLATWLLDDGTLSSRGIYRIYAMRYPRAEVAKVAAAITERFGIEARPRHHRDGMYVIVFWKADSPALSDMIRRTIGVLPGMEGKLLA